MDSRLFLGLVMVFFFPAWQSLFPLTSKYRFYLLTICFSLCTVRTRLDSTCTYLSQYYMFIL